VKNHSIARCIEFNVSPPPIFDYDGDQVELIISFPEDAEGLILLDRQKITVLNDCKSSRVFEITFRV